MSPHFLLPALLGAASFSAFAQVPAGAAPATPAATAGQAPKPQTVKKTVCRRVDDEETTGSRLGSAPKVCKVIEVPAPSAGSSADPSAERGER